MSRIPGIRAFAVAVAVLFAASPGAYAQDSYFPPPGSEWEWRSAAEVGMDSVLVAEAVAFAIDSETSASRDLLESTQRNSEPHSETIGPIQPRGDMTGLIIRHGYIVAEWGEPFRVDMTFSVSKSFLSTTVGLAWDAGLIRDLDDPVREYGPAEHFESPHNQKVTWDHLLRQTSDWEGTLWDKPDWADRPVGHESTWQTRPRNEPGTAWKYNDVRVNLLALAALNVWGEALPDVLAQRVMNPIGASDTWRWHGYENSWVEIGGQRIQSVSGGGHWGGGMFISARDHAAPGRVGRRAPAVGRMVRSGHDTDDPAARLRIHEFFSEYRSGAIAGRARVCLRAPRVRHEHDLRRCRTRPGHRYPVDSRKPNERPRVAGAAGH